MDFLLDALNDTLEMAPFLLVIFLVMEILEGKWGDHFREKMKSSGKFGPILGALLGIIPQCGFSVMGVAMYSEGVISLGTLISIFISTSDEAIPILVSTPSAYGRLIFFIISKVIFAIFFGYLIDFALNKFNISLRHEALKSKDTLEDEEDYSIKGIIISVLKRTLKILVYVFIITAVINYLFTQKNINEVIKSISSSSYIQIILSALVGLIPNCAVSVGLVEVYLKGALSFAALVAGLSSNAGLALIVLFKEAKKKKTAFIITLILYTCAIIAGFTLMLFKI